MLITAIKLGRSHDVTSLGDLRGYDMEKLEGKLDGYTFRIEDGELRVWKGTHPGL
jgi:hypothetical protein